MNAIFLMECNYYVTLSKAPAVSYDQYDDLHKKFLHDHFNVPRDSVINHTVGSSEAFVRLALSGVAYCLIPRLQIIDELESGAIDRYYARLFVVLSNLLAPLATRERGIKRDISSDIKLYPQSLTSVSCWFLQRQSCVRSPVRGIGYVTNCSMIKEHLFSIGLPNEVCTKDVSNVSYSYCLLLR